MRGLAATPIHPPVACRQRWPSGWLVLLDGFDANLTTTTDAADTEFLDRAWGPRCEP